MDAVLDGTSDSDGLRESRNSFAHLAIRPPLSQGPTTNVERVNIDWSRSISALSVTGKIDRGCLMYIASLSG